MFEVKVRERKRRSDVGWDELGAGSCAGAAMSEDWAFWCPPLRFGSMHFRSTENGCCAAAVVRSKLRSPTVTRGIPIPLSRSPLPLFAPALHTVTAQRDTAAAPGIAQQRRPTPFPRPRANLPRPRASATVLHGSHIRHSQRHAHFFFTVDIATIPRRRHSRRRP